MQDFSEEAVTHTASTLALEGFIVTYPQERGQRKWETMHVSWDLSRVHSIVGQLEKHAESLRQMRQRHEELHGSGYSRRPGENTQPHDERIRRLPHYAEYVRLRAFHTTRYVPALRVITHSMSRAEIDMAFDVAQRAFTTGEFKLEKTLNDITIDWESASRLGF